MATIKNNYINYCNVSINISKYEKSQLKKYVNLINKY
jgi:hypothetical protein